MTRALAIAALCLAACGRDPGPPPGGGGAADAGGSCQNVGGHCATSQDCCASQCVGATCQPFDVNGGVCAQVATACRRDAECCSGHCDSEGLCQNGYPVSCNDDSVCPSGTTCLVCIHECIYPAHGYCDTLAPCPCGYGCTASVCTDAALSPGSCQSDVDCPAGFSCNSFTQQCNQPMCQGPAGDSLPDGGIAPPAACDPGGPACPQGERCISYAGQNLCLRSCSSNPNCPTGQFCDTLAPSVQACGYDCTQDCSSDADCGQGHYCNHGQCEQQDC
ncbi:MAG: hypothetical protein ACYCWW_14455 [Deltaproteobacteria bacterium]